MHYSRFDYHGMGTMLAWLVALLWAGPVLWLASKIFLGDAGKVGLFGRASNGKATVSSLAIAFGFAVPMHSQLSYLIGLPLGVAMPVWISSLAWLVVVEAARTAAVDGNLLAKNEARASAAMAALITLPKLTLVGFALIGT